MSRPSAANNANPPALPPTSRNISESTTKTVLIAPVASLPVRHSQLPPGTQPKPGPPLPPKAKVAVALYDFTGERSTDLSFKEGDLISIVQKTDNLDDWWKGTLNGKTGDFPANYVQLK